MSVDPIDPDTLAEGERLYAAFERGGCMEGELEWDDFRQWLNDNGYELLAVARDHRKQMAEAGAFAIENARLSDSLELADAYERRHNAELARAVAENQRLRKATFGALEAVAACRTGVCRCAEATSTVIHQLAGFEEEPDD